MSLYYNIFKDTEFVIQNTNTNKTYKAIKQYQSGGDNTILIYDDNTSEHLKKNTNKNTNKNFFNSCKQSKMRSFKQPILQIGGFNIQL